VIVDGFMEVGLNELVGEHRAYVNVSRDFLLSVRPLPLPPKRVVLELLEDQQVDDELLEVLAELRGARFQIALDDFVLDADSDRLLEHADIVKVDVMQHAGEALEELVATLRERRPTVTLLAEKVEAREEFDRCCELGFQAFQGYFFARPSRVQHQRLPSRGLLSAMGELNTTEDFDELHRIITRDAGLSMRLLRYANSAYLYLPRRVGSVHEALTLLGASTVRRFALMVALAGARDVPNALLVTALVRARMCQLLAGENRPEGETAFTIGLFSVADALVDSPMATVLEELPFRDEVAAALLDGGGPLGELLAGVEAYERGDFDGAAALLRAHPELPDVYRQAVLWADLNMGELI
jgi:EAL and modified HD-GYP domain-containing signal transduction protein